MRLLPLLLVAALASPAFAQTPMEKARETYQAGVAAFQGGMFKDAELAFRDVYDLIHTPEVLYDIALTLEKQRKWGPSADVYEAYLRDSKKVKDRGRIAKRVEELRGRAKRQEELDAALNSGQSPKEVAAAPGNEMMKLGDAEDNLMSFGEASGEDDARAARANADQPSDSGGAPIYKKWWLWAAVGAVVVVAVVVSVVAVAASGGGAPAMTTFPDIGPGAKTAALLRF